MGVNISDSGSALPVMGSSSCSIKAKLRNRLFLTLSYFSIFWGELGAVEFVSVEQKLCDCASTKALLRIASRLFESKFVFRLMPEDQLEGFLNFLYRESLPAHAYRDSKLSS